MTRTTGIYVETATSGEKVRAFVPKPLPPEPAVAYSPKINELLQEAEAKLSLLRMATLLVPNADVFSYAFVRKEAILSSQIEGIQATLADLMNYEANPQQAGLDVQEVCNYLDALWFARKELNDPNGLPLSLRLIREMHKRLMRGVRGQSKNPGEFRDSQNWIGGTRPSNAHFVPPPKQEMLACMSDLEKYLNQTNHDHPLVRIGLVHVQFETIHPFLDGNGRVGRLLIAILLEAWGLLDARLLYLSLHFKRQQQEYYRRLDAVRFSGDWEAWIEFFLQGVCTTSDEAMRSAQALFQVIAQDRKKLMDSPKVTLPALRLFEMLPGHPVLTTNQVVSMLNTTKPTAISAIGLLQNAKILVETTGAKRNQIFAYKRYNDILAADA